MSAARFNPPPGWPPAPAGWVPDANWRPDPSWPPAPPGWQWWVAVEPPREWPGPATLPVVWHTGAHESAGGWPHQSTSPPRSPGLRVFLTCLIVLAPLLLVFIVDLVVAFSIDPARYPTEEAFSQAISDATDTVTWLYVVAALIAYGFLASKVGFRWFDTFFQLIPIYGLVWLFRVAHRLAYLPHRDWPARDEQPLLFAPSAPPSWTTPPVAAPVEDRSGFFASQTAADPTPVAPPPPSPFGPPPS